MVPLSQQYRQNQENIPLQCIIIVRINRHGTREQKNNSFFVDNYKKKKTPQGQIF